MNEDALTVVSALTILLAFTVAPVADWVVLVVGVMLILAAVLRITRSARR